MSSHTFAILNNEKVGAALRAAMDGVRSRKVAAEDSGSHTQTAERSWRH